MKHYLELNKSERKQAGHYILAIAFLGEMLAKTGSPIASSRKFQRISASTRKAVEETHSVEELEREKKAFWEAFDIEHNDFLSIVELWNFFMKEWIKLVEGAEERCTYLYFDEQGDIVGCSSPEQ